MLAKIINFEKYKDNKMDDIEKLTKEIEELENDNNEKERKNKKLKKMLVGLGVIGGTVITAIVAYALHEHKEYKELLDLCNDHCKDVGIDNDMIIKQVSDTKMGFIGNVEGKSVDDVAEFINMTNANNEFVNKLNDYLK